MPLKSCKHFTGFGGMSETGCGLGLNPREMVGGSFLGWTLRAPCYTTSRSADQVACTSYEEPDPAEEAEQERHLTETMSALANLQQGVMVECSKCGKPIAYREHTGGFVFGCPCGYHSGRGCSPRRGR